MSETIRPIITISREYGAGGHTIAKGIANALGLEYYDVDFLKAAAAESGYTEEEVAAEGEELSGGVKLLQHLLPSTYNDPHNEIFEAQKRVILRLAAEKPCIIVGRCSNIILRENNVPSYDIFLHADLEHRIQRASQLNTDPETDVRKYVETTDKNRKNYYEAFTGHTFGACDDYDISIDTGRHGFDQTIEILLSILKPMFD